jgi:hypothetical protein
LLVVTTSSRTVTRKLIDVMVFVVADCFVLN